MTTKENAQLCEKVHIFEHILQGVVNGKMERSLDRVRRMENGQGPTQETGKIIVESEDEDNYKEELDFLPETMKEIFC